MIFYFSATGNTQKMTSVIAERIEDTCINIETALKNGTFEYTLKDGERLGFCFPVYFGNIPNIVVEFIDKLKIKTAENSYYCFVAMTSGGFSAYAPYIFMQKLLKHGLTTSAIFELVTIDTFLPMYTIPEGEIRQNLEAKVALKTQFMAEQIYDKTAGHFHKKVMFSAPATWFMKWMYQRMQKTSHFQVSEACNACGLCAKNCPIQAIEISAEGKKPAWTRENCMLCMRCVHHCPHEAIDYGKKTVGKTRYRI